MKSIKKIVGIVLALIMVMAMSSSVFAAENTTTISVKSDDTRSYDVYQIFTGDVSGQTLSNVKWGANGTGTEGEPVSSGVLKALVDANTATNGITPDDLAKLAVIKSYVNFDQDAFGTVDKDHSLTVPTGYYLCVDKGTVGNGEAYSLYVVKVAGQTVIEPKRGTVMADKKVEDVNDSVAGDGIWGYTADYDIGDAVPFKLSATLPQDYGNYNAYKLTFHDTQSEGLTFNSSSVKVYVGETEISTDYYTVVTEGLSDGCSFEVRFENVKNIETAVAGSTITVEYTATLNGNATIGGAGNPNTMHVEYSNDPNNSQGGVNDPTGTTPDAETTVFTYKLVVNKVDEDNKALTGAGFTLYKKINGVYAKIGEEITGGDITTFEWNGLDDGSYKLVETTTPAGYNTIDDIEFNIIANTNGQVSCNSEKFTVSVPEGSLTTDVVNTSGSILPSTGGMGTTMLYIVGALLIIGAGTVLVMRRRKAEEN